MNSVALAIIQNRTWSGASDTFWQTNGNWDGIGGAAPDDKLFFPDAAIHKSNNNNFPINTNFSFVVFNGGGYTVSGQAIFLGANGTQGGFSSSVTSGTPLTFIPNILLGKSQTFANTGTVPYTLSGVINLQGHALTLDGGGTHHIDGPINGSGTLIKAGAGTAILTDVSVAGGPITTVNFGTLEVDGTIGAVTVNAGTLSGNGTVGTLTGGSGLHHISPGNAVNLTAVLTAGAVTLNANSRLDVHLNGLVVGTGYDRLAATSIGLNGATLVPNFGFTPAVGDQFVIVTTSTGNVGATKFAQGDSGAVSGIPYSLTYNLKSVVLTVLPSVRTWTGAHDANWSSALNWNAGVPVGSGIPLSGDSLFFPASAPIKNLVNDLPANKAYTSIQFNGTGYAMTGTAIDLSGGMTETAGSLGAAVVFDLPIRLTHAQTFGTGNNGIFLGATLNLNGFALTLAGGFATATITGQISGAGGITKVGTGTWRLNTSNTYTGITQINAGKLVITGGGALGATGAGNHTVVADGASLELSGAGMLILDAITLNGVGLNNTGGALRTNGCPGCSVSGLITLGSDSHIGVGPSDTLSINGGVAETGGARALSVVGGGQLTFTTSSNNYSGGTTIQEGTKLLVSGTIGAVGFGQSGGTLGGSGGTVASIAGVAGGSPGIVAPGASAGNLNVNGNVTLVAQSIFNVELGGLMCCTQYDRLTVTGTVNLGGATLTGALINSFVPVAGNAFTIIQSTGALSGQFAGPASITIGGVPFNITYGTNSVILTAAGGALPDLTVTKTHTGNFTNGQVGATYTATVTNSGAADKIAGTLVTLVDSAPTGLLITAMSGTGWTCAVLPTCTRSDLLAAFQSYPPVTITVNVASTFSPKVNSVTVSTAATEGSTANNTANDSTVILLAPDLTVLKSHAGDFAQGQIGALYTVTVNNIGFGDKTAGGTVTVTESVPSGLSLTAMSGTGWTCTTLPACTRTDLLPAGQSYPSIAVTVNVAGNATSPQINSVSVAMAGTEGNTGNNSASDPTVITQSLPDLTITKSHAGDFALGQVGATYTVIVTNSGAADKPAATLVTVTDSPPAGLAVTAMSGTGWTCTTLPTCTRSDVLAASLSYPPVTITVTVAATATTPLVNSVAVTTAATESNTGNNTANDSTTIILPDLVVTKSHAGNFSPGQIGAVYTATVTNFGLADKPAGSQVSLVDSPPAGLTVTAMSGTCWTCTVLPTCTRSDVLASLQSYPPLTITVTVAGNATSPQVNSVTVATTATESNTANNSDDDTTTIGAGIALTVTKSGSGSVPSTVTSLDGGITCGATCTNNYSIGANVTLTAAPAVGSVFTGWLGPCTGTGTCLVTISSATTVSATFALSSIVGANVLDIDANTQYDPQTDALMIVRYMFGLRGAAVTAGALGTSPAPTRTDSTQISDYLNDILPYLDVDGNGAVDALTDGLLIIRNLLGVTGPALTQGAIGTGATRITDTQISNYLTTLKP